MLLITPKPKHTGTVFNFVDTNLQIPFLKMALGSIMDRRRVWHVFRVFNFCRLALAAILLAIFFLDENNRVFGNTHPRLFQWTTITYIGLVVLAIAASFWRRPILKVQAHIQTLVDLIGLSLLIHASGGITSSLNILLVTAIAASAILLPLYSALLAAALAFFILIGYWFYTAWDSLSVAMHAPDADVILWQLPIDPTALATLGRLGVLGASFFIAALLTYTLAERARRSEVLVRHHSLQLLEMAELTQAIVRHLQSGIVVVDSFARIRLMNDTARELLNYHDTAQSKILSEISPALSQSLAGWIGSDLPPKPFRSQPHLPEVMARFTHLGSKRNGDILVFLEDSEHVTQRLQQLKLAALGRMTAGIAHEIRNPLTSISHAAQLLGESSTVGENDKRLGEIIHANVKRANRVISNVLDLSRRDKIKPEDIDLQPWLEEFRREFLRNYSEPQPQIEIRVQPSDLAIRFDASHLYQILYNLCNNACIHGTFLEQVPHIVLVTGQDTDRSRPYLDVIDDGPGIAETEVKRLFEPFFTTRAQGTGLGLYISREMCETNRAQLQYIRPPEGGSCMRITFANPSKQDVSWKRAMP